jgi:predicted alpha/beta-fold hydrolase
MNFLYKLLKYPFFGKYMVKWRNPLSEMEKKEWQKVTVKSNSKSNLEGLFAFSKTKIQKATLVLAHPMGKEAKGFFLKREYSEILRNEGFNILVFDINGFGESKSGNFAFFEDIKAMGHHAKIMTPKLPVGYFGISLGAQWAAVAFKDPTHPYQFAILESGATTLEDFWKPFKIPYYTLLIMKRILPKYYSQFNSIKSISEAKNLQSILFIYSEIDTLTPIEMGKKYHKECQIPNELFILKTSDHARSIKSEEKDIYIEKIIGYFNNEVIKFENDLILN